MQRRKGQAHISPPSSSPSSAMSDEKHSRLNQRNFGVKNRIWLILFLFVFIVSLTHYVLPATPKYEPFSTVHLKSKNYLNNTVQEPNPFEFCPVYGPGDALGAKYGALTLSQSRMHLGSSARVNRVINRALAGQPVTISVLGGSGERPCPLHVFSAHSCTSFRLPRCWRRPSSAKLLSFSLLPMVDLCLSPSRL